MNTLFCYFKKGGFEKKIFLIFFITTIFVVLVLTAIEWQIGKYFICKYEDEKIKKYISTFMSAKIKYESESLLKINELVNNPKLKLAMRDNNFNEINQLFTQIQQKFQNEYFALYNIKKDQLSGERWNFIDKYISPIYKQISNQKSGLFLANFNHKIYSITFAPIYADTLQTNLCGFVVNSDKYGLSELGLERFQNNAFPQDIFVHTNLPRARLLAFPLQESIEKDLRFSDKLTRIFLKKLDRMILRKQSNAILRLNSEIATGVVVDYDLSNDPSVLYISNYNRDFYSFAQKSALLILLVILSITFVIISLLGNWFGKRIIKPINEINRSMKSIKDNPEKMDFVSDEYRGELGEMSQTFNSMNTSLFEHRKSLEEYKLVTENLKSGIFWLDNDLEITFCNFGLARIFSFSTPREIIGKKITEFVPFSKKMIEQAQSNKLVILNREIKIVSKESTSAVKNNLKYIVINLNPVKINKQSKLVGSITDISKEVLERKARRELELELIKSNKLATIGGRVEGVIHNINSPLNSVLGYSQLLKKKHKTDQDINKIIEAGKIISSYIKTLQKKMQNEEISTARPLNINELIEQELEFSKHNLFFKHYVKTHIQYEKPLPKIEAVYSDISVCFTNILNNAIESLSGSEEKTIQIRTFQKNKSIAFEISDTGCGIEQKNLKKIFKPDFTTKKRETSSGFGLGLAICKRIADKHKGSILVESKIDKGSTFTFLIPIPDK